ncbi:MAG: alpha/beta hydrolase [Dysosmobacter welbionis]
MLKPEELHLTWEWDKTLLKATVWITKRLRSSTALGSPWRRTSTSPKDAQGRLPAVAVCGPFGAVKEQFRLYAHAGRAWLPHHRLDPSFTGERRESLLYRLPGHQHRGLPGSGGFLSVQDSVDPERIGILGICGWGGLGPEHGGHRHRIRSPWSPPCMT